MAKSRAQKNAAKAKRAAAQKVRQEAASNVVRIREPKMLAILAIKHREDNQHEVLNFSIDLNSIQRHNLTRNDLLNTVVSTSWEHHDQVAPAVGAYVKQSKSYKHSSPMMEVMEDGVFFINFHENSELGVPACRACGVLKEGSVLDHIERVTGVKEENLQKHF